MKSKRIAALVLATSFVMSGANVSAAWDGYKGESTVQSKPFFDTSNILKILDTDHTPVMKGVAEASPNSVYWVHTGTNPQINILSRGYHDLTEYSGIYMWMYSEKKTNSKIAFYVTKAGGGYFLKTISINWEGWKKISIPFDEFTINGTYQTPDWSDIQTIDIYAHGWSMVPDPETVLYINSVYFSKPAAEETALDINSLKEYLDISCCFYAGSENYLAKNAAAVYKEGKKAEQLHGKCYIPVDEFKELVSADFKISENKVIINGKDSGISAVTFGDTYYLAVEDVASAFSKNVISSRNLVIVSDDDKLNELKGKKSALDLIAKEVSMRENDYSSVTNEDIDEVLIKWEKYLTGADADGNDSYVQMKRKTAEQNALTYQNSMNKSADAPVLWGDEPCKATTDMSRQYGNIYAMALGYATPSTATYKNIRLKDDIVYALDWCYDHLYGPAEVRNEGWRDTSAYNWLEWNIIVPRDLTRTVLLIRDALPKSNIEKYFEISDYFLEVKFGSLLNSLEKGANTADRVYSYSLSKLLRGDAQKAGQAISLIERDLAFTNSDKGDGQHTDGSYRFHTYYAMNGLYAVSFMTAVVPLMTIVADTKFEITGFNADDYTEWLLKSYENSIYNGRMMSVFRGREPGFERSFGQSVVSNLLEYSECVGNDDRAKLRSYIKYLAKENYINPGSFTVNQYRILNEILADENTLARNSYTRFNMFYRTDKATWQNNDYAMAISMNSERISGWESINGVNKKGWYMGDGMVYLYTKEDTASYEGTFWKDVNYYRLPGTTVDTQERKAVSIRDSQIYMSGQDFVGGVNHRDNYGIAAMVLESCHNDIESNYTSEYGDALPVHNNDLMAKKAYFVFDDEMVALGSDIDSTMNYDVETIVENRLSSGIKKLSEDGIDKYDIISVSATAEPQAENPAKNVADDDFDSRWSAENEQSLTVDLGEIKEVGMVGIALHSGSTRRTKYDIYLSADGANYTEIFAGESSGTTDDLEIYDGKKINARYVKFDFHGNSASSWNSVTEIAVYPPRADGVIALPPANNVPVEALYIDGERLADSTDIYTKQGAKWANLEGSSGYVFLDDTTLSARKLGNSKSAFTEIWIEHGKNPKDAHYAYVTLPKKNREQTKEYSQNPDVKILSNTPQIQAVRENKLNITGIIFYEGGSLEGINAENPCIVMMTKADNSIELSVSDPTQKQEEIALSLDLDGYSLDTENTDVKVREENGKIIINTLRAGGATFDIKLIKK